MATLSVQPPLEADESVANDRNAAKFARGLRRIVIFQAEQARQFLSPVPLVD
jgi:hypothetical protein